MYTVTTKKLISQLIQLNIPIRYSLCIILGYFCNYTHSWKMVKSQYNILIFKIIN